MAKRTVLLYELNEVAWLVLDRYLARTPGAPLAGLLERSATFTTVVDDPNPLEPWRTWPILHTGLSSDQHGSLDLGQDPASFRGEPLWEAAARQGRKVGVFGPLQSWPAREFATGGFFVPDTFARTADCLPEELTRVQAINLRLTQDNTFSADAPLPKRTLLTAPLTFMRAGVRPASAVRLAGQIARELVNRQAKSGRSILQAVPMFDIFMRQMEQHQPDLGVFFTNHVAGMMHRYWADGMAEFGDATPYAPDPLHQGLVWKAMGLFDQQLQRVARWSAERDDRVVVVASSMGQAEIPYEHVDECFVVEDAAALLRCAGAPPGAPGLAMYPAYSFDFADAADAQAAHHALAGLSAQGAKLFEHVRTAGTTVHVDIVARAALAHVASPDRVNLDGRAVSLGDAGIVVRRRLGGGNTAHHIPYGSLFMFGAGVTPDASRRQIDLRDVKDLVLEQLGCAIPATATAATATPATATPATLS